MTAVTQQAVRVYAALSQLRQGQGDVMDALVPFFEPILARLNETLFDPALFSKAVERLYGWHFTPEIAEEFIPRLVRRGLLKRTGTLADGAYVVVCAQQEERTEDASVIEFLERITNEFVKFAGSLTEVVQVNTDPDNLREILIRFLVSLNAFTESSLRIEIEHLSVDDPVSGLLVGLEQGARALPAHDRYLCARFVKHSYEKHPAYVPFLSRIASIGLLTEVVVDFTKPTSITTSTDLTVIMDAPLALHYLGLSKKATTESVQNVFDSLKAIGCRLVVLPDSCEEMSRVLSAMLNATPRQRRGPTWDAMRRHEVSEDFVRAVKQNPEDALEHVGVKIRRTSLDQYPSLHHFFSRDHYETFLSSVGWVPDIPAREHDTTCIAITMRLREGAQSSDVFRCKYVFVTANPTFAAVARRFCLQNRLIRENQCGPVIHQREMATLAWLRTGLGADDLIPRSYLIGACEDVLRVRPEVMNAVYDRLKELTPDRLPELELLVANHRSVERLMDQTLGDAQVVTAANAPKLLEAMERATAEKLEQEFEVKLEQERLLRETDATQNKSIIEATQSRLAASNTKVAALEHELRVIHQRREQQFATVIMESNDRSRRIESGITMALFLVFGFGVLGYIYTPFQSYLLWKVISLAAGCFGAYHLFQHIRQRPLLGVGSILTTTSRMQFKRTVKKLELADIAAQYSVIIEHGRINALPKK